MKNYKNKKIKFSLILTLSFVAGFLGYAGLALASVNLVANPSVESSTPDAGGNPMPDNWSIAPGWGTNDRAHSYVTLPDSTMALKVVITSYTDGDAKWVFDNVPANAGALYRFSDRYMSNATTYIFAGYTLADASIKYEQIAILPSSGGVWENTTQEFTPPSNTVSMNIFHALPGVGELTTDDYSVEEIVSASDNLFSKGIVSITFDDGWVSQYDNAYPALTVANLPATFYAISNAFLNNVFGYMTGSQLLDLQDSGHEVSAHTQNHCNLAFIPSVSTCAFAPATGATQTDEIVGSRDALINLGITPALTFAYPNGGYNDLVKTIVSNSGISLARTVDIGFNTRYSDKFALKTQVMEEAIPIQTVKNWIDYAGENNMWLILTFHQVDTLANLVAGNDDGGVTPQYFQEIVDYLVTKQNASTNSIDVKTVAQVIPFMAGSVLPVDTTAPVITLNGGDMTVFVGETFTDPGATANDNIDGNISGSIIASGTVDTSTIGDYTISYNVSDSAGNNAVTVTRLVSVLEPAIIPTNTAPVITLVGSSSVNVSFGSTYTDAGATAFDAEDGDITSSITNTNPVNTGIAGTYTVTFSVTDSEGLPADSVTRTVIVGAQPSSGGGGGGGGSSGGSGGGGGGGFSILPIPTIIPIPAITPVVTTNEVQNPGTVLGATCEALLTQNLRKGNKANKLEEVKKLQNFLNVHMGEKLVVDGQFGPLTNSAVLRFQEKYKDEILTPVNLTKANGNVYKFTRAKIDSLNCAIVSQN